MTSTFDFLMVLFSIIIGISMAEILSAVGHVIQGATLVTVTHDQTLLNQFMRVVDLSTLNGAASCAA